MRKVTKNTNADWRVTAFAGAIVTSLALFSGTAHSGPLYDSAFDARYNDFSNDAALDNFAGVAVDAGQYDQALSTYEQQLFADPNNLDARLSIARIYYQVGEFDLAQGHIEQALVLDPGNGEALFLSRQIDKAVSGVTAYLDVTVGGVYQSIDTKIVDTFSEAQYDDSRFGGAAYIDGFVSRDLQTATRDNISLAGGLAIEQRVGDPGFNVAVDEEFVDYNLAGGYAALTFSKGLPDIIDTLRADVSFYGEIFDEGADRIRREIGIDTRISFRPTVESLVYADFNYAWLGESSNFSIDDVIDYGLGAQVRFAPSLTGNVFVGRKHTRGAVELDPIFVPPTDDYAAAETYVAASLTHRILAFGNGQSWFQRLSARYSEGTTLDYGLSGGPFASEAILADREAWQLNWDHTVQTSTNGQLEFGVGYFEEELVSTDPLIIDDVKTRNTGWTAKLHYKHRFR